MDSIAIDRRLDWKLRWGSRERRRRSPTRCWELGRDDVEMYHGGQPSRGVLPSIRTRDRWSLAASPCSYSLLLLATVVVVQLYNFSTVASSKRVNRYRSRFISKRNRREKERERKKAMTIQSTVMPYRIVSKKKKEKELAHLEAQHRLLAVLSNQNSQCAVLCCLDRREQKRERQIQLYWD